MKAIKQAVYSALAEDATVQGYVGDRIYLSWPPEKPTYPLITFRQVGGAEELADGVSFLVRPRIEVKIWAESGLEDIAEAVRSAMRGVPGIVKLVSDVDLFDHNSLKHVKVLDFSILTRL
ncbi:MAG: DUF3168 domain-containing protein [Actinomycetota bacterium]